MRRTRIALAALSLSLLSALPARANVLLSDNFDLDLKTSQLNAPSLLNWTVDSGTVDYVRSGDFGIACAGGAGGCVDMDGSSSASGRLLSKASFSLSNNVLYTLSLDVSGNQRTGSAGTDTFQIGILDMTSNTAEYNVTTSWNFDAPFVTSHFSFTNGFGLDPTHDYRIFLQQLGPGDNIGVIVDNLLFTDNILVTVPEPSSVALVLTALGLAASAGRRRRDA